VKVDVKVDVKVPVGISGTHGGFAKFCVGKTDISDASRPINHEKAELCAKNSVEYIEVAIGYDGLAVVVNPKNTWANSITTAELKKCGNRKPRARSRSGARFATAGQTKSSTSTARATTPGPMTTSLRRSFRKSIPARASLERGQGLRARAVRSALICFASGVGARDAAAKRSKSPTSFCGIADVGAVSPLRRCAA